MYTYRKLLLTLKNIEVHLSGQYLKGGIRSGKGSKKIPCIFLDTGYKGIIV